MELLVGWKLGSELFIFLMCDFNCLNISFPVSKFFYGRKSYEGLWFGRIQIYCFSLVVLNMML